MWTILFCALSMSAHAGDLAGVTMPDSASIGGQSLVLNGMGLREKYFIDVYVGGLYLPARTRDASKAIRDDVPKRIVMHFVYSSVDRSKLVETFEEGFAKLPDAAALAERRARLADMMQDVVSGDQVYLDYVPGQGTTVRFNNETKGTIEGADFMRAVWTVYLGPNPPTAKLKAGLLGG